MSHVSSAQCRWIKPEYSDQHQPSSIVIDNPEPTAANSMSENNSSDFNGSRRISNEFSRAGRSDAPAPSECLGEPEPLLREMRIRPMLTVDCPPNDESSSFKTSFQDIGKSLKACNDTLGELQSLGVSHDVPLPEMVLVGDQSAGKSSVMSGLANLDLPRSDGTCTRCPLHIRVSHNTDWSCRVSLSKEYTFQPPHGQPITENDVTSKDPFYPWRKLPASRVHEFKTLHDKNDIEDVLRWAQVAILNDDKQYQVFIPGSGSVAMTTPIAQATEETSAKFSPNVVSLEIKGPGLPNLSFYDLPGIFSNPPDARDEYLVNVVRNLSQSYIQRPSAIIMCAIPMNSDVELSTTFCLSRKLGATNRTIGVLTKADLLPDGQGSQDHLQWLKILKGERYQTGLGYFITSRPKDKDLQELTKWEEAMFENLQDYQWPKEFHGFGHRCGVEKLKDFISKRLGEEFVKCLPDIEHKVTIQLGKIERQLSHLPELPENVELEIQRSLIQFTDNARVKIDNFLKHFDRLPTNFRKCLFDIKPRFILKDRSDIPVVNLLDSDSDGTEMATISTPSKKRIALPISTPSKRQRAFTPSVKREDSDGASPSSQSRPRLPIFPPPFEKFAKVGSGFRTVRKVGEEIQSRTKGGVPGRFTDEVYEDLALEAIRPWDGPMNAFLAETTDQLAKELFEALGEAFNSLKKRIVFKEAKKHLEAFLKTSARNAQEMAMALYRDETSRLLTFNAEAFEKYKKDELNLLTRFRHQQRMQAHGLLPLDLKPLELWDKMSEVKQREDTRRREADLVKIGPDQFKVEIEVISFVRGYYKVAALRFADTVSQVIMCRMIPDVKKDLSFFLNQQLDILPGAPIQTFERLMEEDSATASKREMLKREKKKFVKALASIEALNSGDGDAGSADGESVGTLGGGTVMEDVAEEDV